MDIVNYFNRWDIDKEYPRLAMVTYCGNIYVAKQHVPASTDINNADYWIIGG